MADGGNRPHDPNKEKSTLQIGITFLGGIALVDFVVEGVEIEDDDAKKYAASE
jgi:hypothetical protein